MEYEEEDGDEEDNINQEDCWEVISAYFEEKGLVRQQVLAAKLKPLPCKADSALRSLACIAARFVRRLHLQPGAGNRG